MYLSCIVIGKNEEAGIIRCFDSVYRFLSNKRGIDYEIIYVDSSITDLSVILVKNRFPDVRIYKITGEATVAIARNIGAKESNGEYLFFVDADMELNRDFLDHVIDAEGKFAYDFISGQVEDVFSDGYHKNRYKNAGSSDEYSCIAGGIFIVKKSIWEALRGFNTKYVIAEDMDFSLRVAKSFGLKFLRKKDPICKHYTERLTSYSKTWAMLINLSRFHLRAVLLRDHLLNKYAYPNIMTDKLSCAFLFLSLVFAAFSGKFWLIEGYLLITLALALYNYKGIFLNHFFYRIFLDFGTIVAFFMYFPIRRNAIYEKVS